MIFINNVSHENGNKSTASIQFFNLFLFYTKVIMSILLHLPLVTKVGYNKCSYLTYCKKCNKNLKNCQKLEREMKICF